MNDYKYLDIPYRKGKIHCHDTILFENFYNHLMEKVYSSLKFTLPPEWDMDYFLEHLFGDGVICVISTPRYGVIPQECNISGWNVYKHPTRATVSNALIDKSDYIIGKDTELISFRSEYRGLRDTVTYYADILALTSESYKINQLNTRKTAFVNVDTKAQAETMKKAFDNLNSGDNAVFLSYGSNSTGKPWQFFSDNQSYIGTNLLDDLRTIENEFDTAIGLNTANTQKKERMITDEVNANNQSTNIRPLFWIDNLNECFRKVKAMFGVEISVSQRVNMEDGLPREEGNDNGYQN